MTVHFIGAGPGAADLLTLRAVAMLNKTDVCVYAGTYLDGEVLSHCPEGARLIDTQDLNLDQIIDHLVAAHGAGLDVVRLCSGDPSIYSALAEQTRRLDEHGVPWDVTPGVPAYAAAAALLGKELTVPLLTQSVVLTRTQARSTAMPESESLANFARTKASLVLHLAITRIRTLADELVGEYGADCPVAVVANASQPSQVILTGTLSDIADQVEAAGLKLAAVILVGPALDPAKVSESYLYDAKRDRSAKIRPATEPEILLFSYGTLQLREVQIANYGRELTGYPDAVRGYELDMPTITDPAVVAKSGSDQHPAIRPSDAPDASVDGMVFAITPDELASSDAYEVADYQRIAVTLASGRKAWAYVAVDL